MTFSLYSFALHAMPMDVLTQPSKLDPTNGIIGDKDCSQCVQYKVQAQSECRKFDNYLVDQTLNKSLYSIMIKNELLNVCSTYLKADTSLDKINSNLGQTLGHSYRVNLPSLEACFEQNDISFRNSASGSKKNSIKSLTGYLHTLNKNILDNQLDYIKEIASIDRILDKTPLEDIKCNENYSAACESIKKCQSKTENMNDIADLTISGVKKILALEKQNAELHTYTSSKKFTKHQLDEAKKDISEKIKFNYSMIPWVKGDEVNGQLKFIKMKLNHSDENAAQTIFKESYIKQITKGREALKDRYLKSLVNHNCLQNNYGCNSKVFEELNDSIKKSYTKNFPLLAKENYEEKVEINNVLGNGTCVAKLLSQKKEVDETIDLAASIGLGLVTGGVGGVRALGQIAFKFYQTGNHIKGISSAVLLGAEGKVSYDLAQTSYRDCQKALSQLNNDNKSDAQLCPSSGKDQFKISDLKSCMIDATLTVGSAALAIRSTKTLDKVNVPSASEIRKDKISKGLTNPNITEEDKIDIIHSLGRLKLDDTELSKVILKLNEKIATDLDKNRMKNYLNYTMSLRKNDRQKCIDQLDEVALIRDKFIPSGYVQKFYKTEAKFNQFELFKRESIKKQLMKNGKNETVATQEAEALARTSRSQLQSKYYACQSKTPTPEHAVASRRFMSLATVLAPGATAYKYTEENSDKLADDPAKWFGKLGYDMAMTYILTKLSVEMIVKSPAATVVDRYMKASVRTSKVGVVDAVLYSKLYGVSEEEARKKVEEVLQSSEAKKELKILDAYINKTGLIDKFKDSIVDNFRKILKSDNRGELMGLPPFDLGVDSFTNLSEQDLERPEIREKLVKAVLLQMNSGDIGTILSTDIGDKGAERFLNDRAWNASVGIPKAILIGLTTFQVLCVGADYPMTSLATATGVLALGQSLSLDQYDKFKKEFSGQ